jgi:hypothetical protein
MKKTFVDTLNELMSGFIFVVLILVAIVIAGTIASMLGG